MNDWRRSKTTNEGLELAPLQQIDAERAKEFED